jgi:hypothetical protein
MARTTEQKIHTVVFREYIAIEASDPEDTVTMATMMAA